MNTKKIIKYVLIAIPLLFLAKWGIEKVIYDSNKIPEINHHPTHKMKVHGNFSLDENSTLKFAVTYVNNNRKCDDTNWLAGTQFPQRREIALTRSTSPEVECILQFILLRVLNPSKGGRSIFK